MGDTPIIRLNNMVEPDMATILVKFEGLNVGGSIKTRTAYNMIREAEKQGRRSSYTDNFRRVEPYLVAAGFKDGDICEIAESDLW